MKTICSIEEMQSESLGYRREGKKIALVPTMGALHEGHRSLIRTARELADLVVVSIFVNPTQFGPGEDYEAYPRDLDADAAVCRDEGVEVLFAPSAPEMFASAYSTFVEEIELSRALCGKSRPGHFRGVTTVVAKLLNIVLPDVAVFGQKDAQQARVIEQMVGDLNFPVAVAIAPTVREEDGLAMSSRNAYLTEAERGQASVIHRALLAVGDRHRGGTDDVGVLLGDAASVITAGIPSCRIEYAEIVDYATLQPVAKVQGRVLVALAVWVGQTRLIDNLVLGGE